MKKLLLLAVVLGLLMSVNAFARDDSHLQDIKDWTPYLTVKGQTFSYEHKEGLPNVPKVYKYDSAFGYIYFYVKIEMAEEIRNDFMEAMRKDLDKESKRKLENVKLGYMIKWIKIDCIRGVVQTEECYWYSDTNEFIVNWDWKTIDPPRKLSESKIASIISNSDKACLQQAELGKYGVEKVVGINLLEANPYEFEGKTIAVTVQFQRMLSQSSAVFFSGYTDLSSYTSVPDQIIVSGLPKGMHFESGPFSPRMLIVLKGKGTTAGTNVFGAGIKVPHFQYIATISGKQPSVVEMGLEVDRANIRRNMKSVFPERYPKDPE